MRGGSFADGWSPATGSGEIPPHSSLKMRRQHLATGHRGSWVGRPLATVRLGLFFMLGFLVVRLNKNDIFLVNSQITACQKQVMVPLHHGRREAEEA